MATYKFDVEARFGKLHAKLWLASDPKPNLVKNGDAVASTNDLATYFNAEVERQGLEEDDDTIIFRGCGHNDYVALEREIKFGTY